MSTFDLKKFLINEGMTRVSRDRKRLLKEEKMTLGRLLDLTGLDEESVHYIDHVSFDSVTEPYFVSDGSPEDEQFLADLKQEIGPEIERVPQGNYWVIISQAGEPFEEPEEFERMDKIADYHFTVDMGALGDDIWLVRAER